MFLSKGVLEHHKVRYWWSMALVMQAAKIGGWSLKKNSFCQRSFYVKFRRRGLSGLEKVCVRISDHLGQEVPGPGYYSILVGRSTIRLAEVVRDLSGCKMLLAEKRWPEGEVEFCFKTSPPPSQTSGEVISSLPVTPSEERKAVAMPRRALPCNLGTYSIWDRIKARGGAIASGSEASLFGRVAYRAGVASFPAGIFLYDRILSGTFFALPI